MATTRKRGNRWQSQVKLADGSFTAQSFDTKRLAEQWARKTEAARDSGERVKAPSRLTVGAYYTQLSPGRQAVLESSTTDRNLSQWTNHLEPFFGDKLLVELRRSEIKAWVTEMAANGVGVPTMEGSRNLLSAIFTAAMEDDLVTGNPVAKIKLPQHAVEITRWIGPEEIVLIAVELVEPYRFLVELTVHTGLRWGEMAGLKVGAIDPFGRTLNVRTVLTRKGIRDYPKNNPSRRAVPIPDHLRARLLAAMAGKAPTDLLFTGPRGGGLSDRNVNERHLAPACVRAGVEPFSFHGLRHSYISWLVAGGLPLIEVAKLVGHSSTRMIEQRYAHLAPGSHDRAREALSRSTSAILSAIPAP